MARYKFGEIAFNITTKAFPKPEDKDTYIGLEHLDSGSLHVTRWGTPVEITGQKLVMHKGDILFGRRNTYLKRVAIAPHDGLFSAHGMIFRPNTDVIDPTLFPFFIASDYFMDAAIRISVGSLSPTVNWKDLKELVFELPPLPEQVKLAELFGQIEATIQAQEKSLQKAVELRNSFYSTTQSPEYFSKRGYSYRLGTIGTEYSICNNLRKPISQAERASMQGKYPYWGPTSILDHINEYRLDGEYALIGEDGDHFLKYLSWDMTHLLSGKFNVNNHAHVIKAANGNLLKWFYYYYKHRNIEDKLTKQGGGRLKLTKATLLNLEMIIPDAEIQKMLCEQYDTMESTIDAIKVKIDSTRRIMRDMSYLSFRYNEVE